MKNIKTVNTKKKQKFSISTYPVPLKHIFSWILYLTVTDFNPTIFQTRFYSNPLFLMSFVST